MRLGNGMPGRLHVGRIRPLVATTREATTPHFEFCLPRLQGPVTNLKPGWFTESLSTSARSRSSAERNPHSWDYNSALGSPSSHWAPMTMAPIAW